ncbi:YbeF family transcriptional regulator [Rahnella woolbedingensis]|uniref:DNA-binding transcriptional regulator n=1 Tax=Rahnella woolbedingensis TaxID=1510574 RepID=A0A419N9I7_9GAMM|nr:YbeF family transcriptional regulator [Rahnella woolbedingensis]RJT44505.1 DNA-binding transcriptional regulator [Rahnella woolbedingensis]
MDNKDSSASLHKLRSLDLNLLTIFEAVYINKGIVHAANALNLTPSSVSQSIKKLRNIFPDPLFIRDGQGISPTAYATNLHKHISQGFSSILTGLDFTSDNDKSRVLTISCYPFIAQITFPLILRELEKINSHYILQHVPLTDAEDTLIQHRADLVIDISSQFNRSIQSIRLMSDKTVLVCRQNHPEIDKTLSAEQAASQQYASVMTTVGDLKRMQFEIGEALPDRFVAFASFNAINVLSMVSGTDLLAVLPERMVDIFMPAFPVQKLQCDLPVQPYDIMMMYNKSAKNDKTLSKIIHVIGEAFSRQETASAL